MNNLFIMHTQYNLILSISMASQFDKDSNNDLILYSEFKVSPEIQHKLDEIFSRVLYIRKDYEEVKNVIKAEIQLYNQVKISEQFLSQPYDNVYISQDRRLEIILLKHIKKKNSNCCFFSVEEDIYFSLERKPLCLKLRIKEKVKKPLENFLHLALYHETTNNGCCTCYGVNPITPYLYVLFPEAVREEAINKSIIECTPKSLATGIERLYGSSIERKMEGLIIVSDLIERYRNRETVVSLFNEIALYCESNNINFYIKYHPREVNKIQTECRIQELPTYVAVEKIYLEFDTANTIVLGNMSTSVLTAKKLGFKTISIMKMNDPQQDAMRAYKKIGIKLPENNNEMLSIIADSLRK